MSFTYGLDSRLRGNDEGCLRGNDESTLTIRMHSMADSRSNQVVSRLLEELNAAQITRSEAAVVVRGFRKCALHREQLLGRLGWVWRIYGVWAPLTCAGSDEHVA